MIVGRWVHDHLQGPDDLYKLEHTETGALALLATSHGLGVEDVIEVSVSAFTERQCIEHAQRVAPLLETDAITIIRAMSA